MRKSMQLKAVAFAAAAALMGVSGLASASEAAQTAPSTFKPGTYTARHNHHKFHKNRTDSSISIRPVSFFCNVLPKGP